MGELPNLPPLPTIEEDTLSDRFDAGSRELRPLRDPTIEIPGEQDEARDARFEAWKAKRGDPQASLPEFIVWEFLTRTKKQVEGVDFLYQDPFSGGRTEIGGFILDFLIIATQYAWRIQGERFHLFFPQDRARDILAREVLEGRGIRVLDLFENDILGRPTFVLELAWNGQEVQGRIGS